KFGDRFFAALFIPMQHGDSLRIARDEILDGLPTSGKVLLPYNDADMRKGDANRFRWDLNSCSGLQSLLQSRRSHGSGENPFCFDGRGELGLAAELEERDIFIGLQSGLTQNVLHH